MKSVVNKKVTITPKFIQHHKLFLTEFPYLLFALRREKQSEPFEHLIFVDS